MSDIKSNINGPRISGSRSPPKFLDLPLNDKLNNSFITSGIDFLEMV